MDDFLKSLWPQLGFLALFLIGCWRVVAWLVKRLESREAELKAERDARLKETIDGAANAYKFAAAFEAMRLGFESLKARLEARP